MIGTITLLPIAVIEGRGASARGFGEAPSALEAFLSVAGGTLPADDGRHAGEAGDGSAPDIAAAVRTELAIGDGDRDAAGRVSLAFDWNFVSAESVADNLPGRNDYALLTITDGTLSRAITLADAREIGLGASGWRTTTVDLGALLPLGDPPLFLAYLAGVPFWWTLGLWPQQLLIVVILQSRLARRIAVS